MAPPASPASSSPNIWRRIIPATGALKWAMAGRSLRQARLRARCDRRAGRYAADRGRCRRSRFAEGDGRADQIGDNDGRSVSALRLRTGRGLRGLGHRLFRSLRRAGLDAADDRRARGDREIAAARASCFPAASIRCRSNSACSFAQEEAKKVFGAPVSRVKGRVRGMKGDVLGRHRGEHQGDIRRGGERSQPGRAVAESVRVDAGLRRPETAAGQQAGVRRGPRAVDRAVRDGDHQHPQCASLQHADGFSLRQGFRLRRDGADRSGRAGRSQRQARHRRQQCREDERRRTEAGRGAVEGRARERLLRSAVRRHRCRTASRFASR